MTLRLTAFLRIVLKIVKKVRCDSVNLTADLLLAFAFLTTPFAIRDASGYALEGPKWPSASNPMVQLELGNTCHHPH